MREDEQTMALREDEQTTARMPQQWREWNECFFCPTRREEESLLVEWARGQGLTVLP